MRTLTQCREDAFVLNGLVRALALLDHDGGSEARDGRAALVLVLRERAGALAHDLDVLDAAEAAPEALAAAVPRRLQAPAA